MVSCSGIEKHDRTSVELVRVIDGDTIMIHNGTEKQRVRLIGIDTPESVKPGVEIEPYSLEAKAFLEELLLHHSIQIEYDPFLKKTDKYGRELCYVFVDNMLVQEEMLRSGLAKIRYTTGKEKYLLQMEKAQNEAKKNRKNLWQDKMEPKKSTAPFFFSSL